MAVEGKKFRMHPDLPPWAMQPGETDDAFGRFSVYRDLGPTRTIRRVTVALLTREHDDWHQMAAEDRERLTASLLRSMENQSSTYRWVDRARAYDAAMDAERREARLGRERDEVREATARHMQVARGTVGLALMALQDLYDPQRKELTIQKVRDMTVGELLAVCRQGVSMERLLIGVDSQLDHDAGVARMNGVQGSVSDAPTRDELKRIAAEAAAEAARNEPRPVKLTPPPEDDDEAEVR